MKDWTRVGLDCGLLNYPEGDNQIFRIDSYADVYTVRQFVHNLTAEIVAENERLREALKPFAEKFLFPDDTGYADEMRAEEDWSEEANDSQVDDWLIERRWIRKARNAMEGK